jgi:hypothetical protein
VINLSCQVINTAMSKLKELFEARRELGINTYGKPLGTDVNNLETMYLEELIDCLVYREAITLKKAGINVEDVWQHIILNGPIPDEFNEALLKEIVEYLE